MLFSPCYVGAMADYADTLGEIKAYAAEKELQVNLMAQEMHVSALKDAGFSTTPMGIWQAINPIDEFTLEGQAMRRLRYLVNKYQKLGQCRTVEYVSGTVPETDQAICAIVDLWFVLKEKTPPLLIDFKEKILTGRIPKVHRIFLTYRDAQLDNVLVFSRDNLNDGYLMDLEFYAKDVPLGSTEFALTEIIAFFKQEGRRSVSLGATLGTELFEHENGAKEVYDTLLQLKTAGYQDGDANAQYKNKYRPTTTPYYISRPHGSGRRKLNELIFLFGS
jgi:polyketide synthase PksN